MRVRHWVAGLLVALGMACGGIDPQQFQPPAPAPSTWVGTWTSPELTVTVAPDGMVTVAHHGAMSSSVQLPGRVFGPDQVVLGLGPFESAYAVQAPPHLDGTSWTMTFDGIVLTRGGAVGDLLGLDAPEAPPTPTEPPDEALPDDAPAGAE